MNGKEANTVHVANLPHPYLYLYKRWYYLYSKWNGKGANAVHVTTDHIPTFTFIKDGM